MQIYMVTRGNHPGTCKGLQTDRKYLRVLRVALTSRLFHFSKKQAMVGAGTREKGSRHNAAYRGVMKNIIKTRQQMLPAPWEMPYAAQKSQQGGAAINATQNKALSSGIFLSIRCLCSVRAHGQQSRKESLFFAENYLAGHLKDKVSAKSWEQLGYNDPQPTAESCRQTGEDVLVAGVWQLVKPCHHFPH